MGKQHRCGPSSHQGADVGLILTNAGGTFLRGQCPTGDANGTFTSIVPFYNEAGEEDPVEVTERLPLRPPGNAFIYARSSDPGEIWPAIYEKAYAKWITDDASDKPDIRATAFGDPVAAAIELTGLSPHRYCNSELCVDDIWHEVISNCLGRKTANPMVAWTYVSQDASPDGVNYSDANLVANHSYSILGYRSANNQKYIVLRNPYGSGEATLNVDGGTWIAWDAPYQAGHGAWRGLDLATPDGIFGLRVDTFKKYFEGFGLVK